MCNGTFSSQLLLDIADFIYIAVDVNQKVTLINKKGCEILGYSEDEIIGKNWFNNFLPKKVAKEIKSNFIKRIAENKEAELSKSYSILTKEGEERLISWRSTFFNNEEGKLSGVLFSGENITKKRKMEEELGKERERTKQYLDIANVILVAIDANEKVTLVNKKGCELLGYEHEEIIGKNWFNNFLPMRDREKTKEVLQKMMVGNLSQSEYHENLILTKDGEERLIAWDNTFIEEEEGTIISTLSSGKDITEMRKTQRELLESEEKFKMIFNNINDAVYLFNIGEGHVPSNFIEINDGACKMLAYTEDEFRKMSLADLIPKEFQHKIPEILNKLTSSKSLTFESFHFSKEGKKIPVEISADTFLYHNKQMVLSIVRDISERKEIGEKIKSSEALYKALFDNTGTGMMLLEEDFTITLVNNLLIERSGISQDEFTGKKWIEFIRKEERENITNAIKRMGTDFIPPLTFETTDFNILGENKTLLISISIIPETKQHIASLIDITEQKKLEKELFGSEERYRKLFNNIPVALSQTKPNGEIVECNSSYIKLFGYVNAEELKTIHVKELYFNPIERKEILAITDKVGFYSSKFLNMKKKDGSSIWVDLSSKASYDENHKVTHYDNSLKDMTEKKEMEEKLIKSEERLRNMFENIPLAVSTYSSEGDLVDINPAYWKLFGYSKKEECLSTPSINRWFNIRDRERLYDSLRQRNFVHNFETKLYKKDGSEFWGTITAIAQSDTSGEKIYFTTLRDITTERQKEEELKKQTLRYYLEESHLYLSEEERPYISKEAFSDLLRIGYNGLVLSRLPETEWKKDINYKFDFLRIAERGHLKTISSELSKIEQLIEELPSKHIIVIDRLDYLIAMNGFETTLFFIFRLMDIAYLSNHIIIVSLDPATINEKERKSLRKEMRMIESIAEATLPEELIEILEFVHKKNITGDKPSYTDIVEAFSISRPTARKRIKDLINEEYIFELTKGRSKVLGITAKGKAIFD